MSKAIEVCKKNELWSLIKKVSDNYGGDDPEWLKAFGQDVYKNFTLDDALACFRDLAKQCQAKPALQKPEPIVAKEIKYQKPFYRV